MIGPICRTPLAEQNYDTLMAGIQADNTIHTDAEENRKKQEADQPQ